MSDTIFKALREDHDLQRSLISQLVKTSGDSTSRAELFLKIKEELNFHAKAEERYFYNPLIKKDLTIEKARHSIAEHKELDDLVEDLESTDHSSPGWLIKAKELEHKLSHHLEEEEREVFQLAGKALNDKQKNDLTDEYDSYMKEQRMA